MNSKIIKAIIYSLAFASILVGVIAIETCWEYWHTSMTFTTSASLALLSAVMLFCAGLGTLVVMHLLSKK